MNAVARQQVGPNPLRRRAGQGSGALWQTGRRAEEEEEEGEELEERRRKGTGKYLVRVRWKRGKKVEGGKIMSRDEEKKKEEEEEEESHLSEGVI